MRGSQREKNFQKTSLKAKKEFSAFRPPSLSNLFHVLFDRFVVFTTEAEKGQSKNILQIPKHISSRNIFFKIIVEKFDKSKKLLQILRKSVDPQITFSIIRKYFSKYFFGFRIYGMHASFRSATAKNSKILTPTRTGNFFLTSMHWGFYATSRFVFGVNALYG